VYKAIHKITKEERAIKVLNKSVLSLEDEERIMQEINILKQMVICVIV